MTTQKQKLTQQKETASTARRKSYVSYIERYPLYSTLLVLKEYEDAELYEECAIIRDAINSYYEKYQDNLPKGLKFPRHINTYMGPEHQKMMEEANIVVEEKTAISKATLIKLNLPVKDGL